MYNFLCCCFFTFRISCMLLMISYCIDNLVLYYCFFFAVNIEKSNKYYWKKKNLFPRKFRKDDRAKKNYAANMVFLFGRKLKLIFENSLLKYNIFSPVKATFLFPINMTLYFGQKMTRKNYWNIFLYCWISWYSS